MTTACVPLAGTPPTPATFKRRTPPGPTGPCAVRVSRIRAGISDRYSPPGAGGGVGPGVGMGVGGGLGVGGGAGGVGLGVGEGVGVGLGDPVASGGAGLVLTLGGGAGHGGEAGSKRAMSWDIGCVNHKARSGPVVMSQLPPGCPGIQKLVVSPLGVTRINCDPWTPAPPWLLIQKLPSGPTMMPSGAVFWSGVWNVVITPPVVILPNPDAGHSGFRQSNQSLMPTPGSVNQRLPSGPAMIFSAHSWVWSQVLYGTGNSVYAPLVDMRPM